MKLSRRVFLFNILSILLAIVVASLIYMISMAISTQFNMTSEATETLEHTMERQTLFVQLEKEITHLPVEKVTDDMVNALSSRLKLVEADIAIIHNHTVVASSIPLSRVDVIALVQGFNFSQDIINLSSMKVQYKTIPLLQDNGYIFLLNEYHEQTFSIWLNVAVALITFLLVYIAMSAYISRKITKGIIQPIERLKEAAIQISEGELNSFIPEEGNGELLELCKALEQMRIKLKESIDLQQKYDKNRSFLVSSISHDLKTPVTSIKGYIEGILDGVANTPEKKQQYLLTAQRKANLINTMIEDLLLYSKLDLKQMPFNKQPIDFVSYITDGIQENMELLKSNRVRMETEFNINNNSMVYLDSDRFMRVVQNIIDNALHYHERQDPVITIMLRETYSTIILEIKDNGKGMKEGEINRIFDRFYRSDEARTVDTGSGLGLAIAKQIVEAHDGNIWAKSQEGVGTSILISLPNYKGGKGRE
ncbi:sensor histidine kinase [Paenibacillus crassostreae]|uniref:histidine kinase n=1 Tax=Paenibacillus crassostreae TaxID=1763538 RepID=A0A167FCX7_9BACL|nr:ATP-binding protein [Paenibacillus crassostreae]AOZ90811.1 hypothetical protein LPB68_00390 [Paenibacillus crassostreae]OAB76423.1 hypothetical protein PNBC_03140 [Paenibacillus crassostreae]